MNIIKPCVGRRHIDGGLVTDATKRDVAFRVNAPLFYTEACSSTTSSVASESEHIAITKNMMIFQLHLVTREVDVVWNLPLEFLGEFLRQILQVDFASHIHLDRTNIRLDVNRDLVGRLVADIHGLAMFFNLLTNTGRLFTPEFLIGRENNVSNTLGLGLVSNTLGLGLVKALAPNALKVGWFEVVRLRLHRC